MFYSQKCVHQVFVIHQGFTYDYEKERERDAVYVYELNYHRNSVGLIPLKTMMLPAPFWER